MNNKSNFVAGSTATLKTFRTALAAGSSALAIIAAASCCLMLTPRADAGPLTIIHNGGTGSNGHGCCGGNDGHPGGPGTAISASNNDWIHAEANGGNGGAGQGTFGGDGGAGGKGGTVNLTTTGTITLSGVGSAGIYASSNGGRGGQGGDSCCFASVGDGGPGGAGNTITINNSATIDALDDRSSGIVALSLGGAGGNAGSCGTLCVGSGGGGPTGLGGNISITSSGNITTHGASSSFGIFAQSVGGAGGAGGSDNFLGLAGWAGDSTSGGNGGTVTINTTGGSISTQGVGSSAIYAQSIGGGGGAGGGGGFGLFYGSGGSGTAGGSGEAVQVINYATLTTTGDQSAGIYAQSIGGGGGAGGAGASLVASFGGNGGAGQNGGTVDVQNHGVITVSGNANFTNVSSSTMAAGIFAQSVGGGGGDGGAALIGLANFGGTGGAAGAGNTVTVSNDSTISAQCGAGCTGGIAIFAQSVGGGGGNGGGALGVVSFGGSGGGGGDGGDVGVSNSGALTTTAQFSAALFAQSVGGGGGNGNFAGGIASFGGSGGEGGTGHTVTANSSNSIITSGADSAGIFAQSVGGGGGNGGGAVGVGLFASFAMGGGGGSGGDGGTVCVNTSNGACSDALSSSSLSIQTGGDRSTGILAQSVGGGGGNGGFAVSASVGLYGDVSIGLGGKGAMGGHGGDVFVSGGGTITTGSLSGGGPNFGQFSDGIDAESIGGGGGNGGFSVAIGVSTGAALSVAVGGNGGAGNYAGNVTVNTQESVTTYGDQAVGIFARSIGGGGGNGGFAFSGSGSPYASVSLGFGGGGSDGGTSGAVRLDNVGDVTTYGALANGITAQSIGGGGGNGGFSVSAAVTISGSSGSAALSFGGDGGNGGYGSTVHVANTGDIFINGVGSDGILAQSIGGGGGNGGFSGALTVSGGAAFSDSIGGGGGGGNHAGAVDVTSNGTITTMKDNDTGIAAQSIGGGGGNGGFSLSVSATLNSMAIGKSSGGSSGDGGYGDTVSVTSNGTIWTSGNLSYGILAQSIGGGGGNGGFSIAGAFSESGSATGNSVGGNGGNGNYAGAVTVTTNASNTSLIPGVVVYTTGIGSIGILAQSIGGGGGNGGFAADINASIEDGAGDNSLGATGAVGGGGGAASNGGTVTVNNNGTIITKNSAAHGIVAQSIGGGGGNGGFSISGSFSAESDASSNAVGGTGGTGGNGAKVVVNNKGDIQISGDLANGIVAQSIGGGGGNGGFAIGGALSLGGKAANNSVGGNGGNGGTSDEVDVYNYNAITIGGAHSTGIVAQSIGGGGGNAGFAIGLSVSINGSDGVSDTVGGAGGGGGTGGVVNVTNFGSGSIVTQQAMDFGILAQSIGGGGGNGGFTVNGAFSSDGDAKTTVGGGCDSNCQSTATGGGGGDSKTVTVDNEGYIATNGALSTGIVAQSIGGGGGTGGWAGALAISTGGDSASNAVGGSGGAGGSGGKVSVTNKGSIVIAGDMANGILAQSIGGGGGNGGFAISGSLSTSGDAANNSVGSTGGNGGSSDEVDVYNYNVISIGGAHSSGIVAQSIGGGGGNGGFAIGLAASVSGSDGVSDTVGGAGGGGGAGGVVNVTNFANGSIVTQQAMDFGIVAQSIGGGGGNGGFTVSGAFSTDGDAKTSVGGGCDTACQSAATGGGGGDSKTVTVDNAGFIATNGALSTGIVAQSIGGGGGTGGWAGALALSTGGNSASNAIGGSGGVGGTGGAVSVTNETSGTIETFGAGSVGILAQSIGGGGGSGGFAGSLSVSTGGDASNNVGGGSGGGAGNGGQVTVVNAGTIWTTLDNSTAIMAQSIGGGGGNGGFSIAGSGGSGDGSANNVGGAAAGGGDGGFVHVTNSGYILGQGALSHGVVAQSIGGGGGNGGFSVAGTLASGSSGNSQSIGGAGGAGGKGGDVQVDNTGSIILQKSGSVGVLAQSIGGGGGTGGFNGSLDATGGAVGQTVGGTGGNGGNGGNVTVNSSGNITTSGANSIGVLAQSIGGGGGYGGINIAVATGNSDGTSLNIGSRAQGGSNGTVTVHVTGDTTISTSGALSDGLLSQGIGGGGGFGGLSVDDPMTLGPSGATLFLGSQGAGGGNGTADTPTNSATIDLTGAGSLGAVAQSIGGGGGHVGQTGDYDLGSNVLTLSATLGGNSSSGGNGDNAILTNTGNATTTNINALTLVSQSIGGGGGVASFSFGTLTGSPAGVVLQVGGSETLGGNGAMAQVTTSGTTWTGGALSTALLVQSIGGGGGFGSVGVISGIPVGGSGFMATLGATSGAGGTGGAADAEVQSGSITTTGHAAPAIVAQSIGGGGGFAASSGVDSNAIVNLGASGGAGGDAGTATVNNAAVIWTTGNDSHAIVAQSIGGGGGLFLGVTETGTPIDTRVEPMSGGAGGSGSTVTVTNTNTITTWGWGAYGIIAQSIGGGGGFVGGGQVSPNIPVAGSFAGTVGGTGSGGMVDVSTTANIETMGADSTAILVQSEGGSGASDMRVTVAANVIVSGGTGLGHAVSMYGGLRNILDNAGTLETQPLLGLEPQQPLLGQTAAQNFILNTGIEEFVITGTFGSNIVNNSGQIYGNVDMQLYGPYSNTNPFTIQTTGYFAPGNTVRLGDAANTGNMLTNAGWLSPGDFYNVMTTTLTGNFTQTSTGNDLTDIDLNPNTTDRINASGTAALAGTVTLSFNNPGWSAPGTYDRIIVSAAGGRGGTTFTTLASPPSAVFTPTLTYPNATDADLTYTVDFSPAGLTGNQHSIGNAINGIQTAGVPAFRIVAAELFFIPTVPLLGKTYDSLSGEGVSGIEQAIFYSRTQFFDAAMKNASFALGAGSGPFALGDGGTSSSPGAAGRWRFWMSGFAGSGYSGGRPNVGSAKDDFGSAGGSVGIEYRIDDTSLVGFTAGGSQANFNVPARQTVGHGVGANFGFYGMKMFSDNVYLSGLLSYGHYANLEQRSGVGVGLDATHPWPYINQPLTPIPVENTRGTFHSQMFGGQIEVGRKYVFEDGNLTPFLNIQFDNQWLSAFDEKAFVTATGAPGILGLHYEGMYVPSVPLTLGVQADTSFDVGGGQELMPVVRLGWRHEFETKRPVQGGFLIAPGFDFESYGAEAARDALDLDTAVVFKATESFSIYANFGGKFSHSGTDMSGTVGLKVRL